MGQAELKDLFLKEVEGLTPSASPVVKPTIKSLNFSHEAIIQWLMANPEKIAGGRMKACADHFGYTQGWLSIIVHSDAFQAKYREMLEAADALIIADIPAKLRGVASRALDGLSDQVDAAVEDRTVAPRDFLLKTSETLLKSLGYGQGGKGITVNAQPGAQVNFVSEDALSRARGRLTAPRANEPKLISDASDTAS